MRKICAIVSYGLWVMGLLILVTLFLTILKADKMDFTQAAARNPVADTALALVMLVFSLGATYMRSRLVRSPQFPGLDQIAGTFFWLCLLAFAVCFAMGTGMVGVLMSLAQSKSGQAWVFFSLSAAALLFALPRLPRPQIPS